MKNQKQENKDVRALLWIFGTMFGDSIHISQVNRLRSAERRVFSRFGSYRDISFKTRRMDYDYSAVHYLGDGEDPRQSLDNSIITPESFMEVDETHYGSKVITLPQGIVYSYYPREWEKKIDNAIQLANNPRTSEEELEEQYKKMYFREWSDDHRKFKRNRQGFLRYLNNQKTKIIEPDDEKELTKLRNTFARWKEATHHDG
jgi:hypothetical protein